MITKAKIMEAIRAKDRNASKMGWKVLENSEDRIVITNNYDETVRFELVPELDEIGNCAGVRVEDKHLNECLWYVLVGNTPYDDANNKDDGMFLAAGKAVDQFYYYY